MKAKTIDELRFDAWVYDLREWISSPTSWILIIIVILFIIFLVMLAKHWGIKFDIKFNVLLAACILIIFLGLIGLMNGA